MARTPGPWSVVDRNRITASSGVVAIVPDCGPRHPAANEIYANARLIASAPALLAALEYAVLILNAKGGHTARERDEATKIARAAIAAAKGKA